MGLRAPNIILFLLSVILAVVVVIARYFDANIPMLASSANQFAGLIVAYLILVVGTLGRR